MAIATGNQILAADVVDGANMPAGSIIIWAGTIASIPAGWIICDGNGGTPNLLAKFVEGVATAATNPGTTGGAATHGHTITTASHLTAGGDDKISGVNDGNNLPPFYDVAYLYKT